jgi:hypothetical protein
MHGVEADHVANLIQLVIHLVCKCTSSMCTCLPAAGIKSPAASACHWTGLILVVISQKIACCKWSDSAPLQPSWYNGRQLVCASVRSVLLHRVGHSSSLVTRSRVLLARSLARLYSHNICIVAMQFITDWSGWALPINISTSSAPCLRSLLC